MSTLYIATTCGSNEGIVGAKDGLMGKIDGLVGCECGGIMLHARGPITNFD